MCDFLNDCDLKKPPFITIKSKNAHQIAVLQPVINDFLKENVKEQADFAEAAALLSRLMARRKNSFRRLIGFSAIQKLNSALCRLLRVDFKRDLESFCNSLPDLASIGDAVNEVPTLNNLDYILVRLIAVHRIYQRVRECCKDGASHFTKMMSTNFFVEVSTLFIAVFAKLYSLSGLLGNKCVELYARLLAKRKYFKQHGSFVFLPSATELPAQLEECTVVDLNSDSSLASNDRTTISSPIPTTVPSKKPPALNEIQKKTDLGTTIEREKREVKTVTIINEFDISQLSTVDAIQKFITTEDKARKSKPTQCHTKEILSHEWLGVKKLFKRKMLVDDHKKAISVFCKFLATKIGTNNRANT